MRLYNYNENEKKITQIRHENIFLLGDYNDEIITLKNHFYTDEKLFELFCIKNDFAKYSPKYCNLFI